MAAVRFGCPIIIYQSLKNNNNNNNNKLLKHRITTERGLTSPEHSDTQCDRSSVPTLAVRSGICHILSEVEDMQNVSLMRKVMSVVQDVS